MGTDTTSIHKVFRDPVMNEELSREGFVIVDFLSPDEVIALTSVFYTEEDSRRDPFTTFASGDYDYRVKTDAAIKSVFARRFAEIFDGYLPFWGNFFIKKPQSPAMPVHADLQYVDEPGHISVNIWCPLVDTGADNGTLGLVPYSHRLVRPIRGTNVTDGYRLHAGAIGRAFGRLVDFRAGQAVIYDHRVLHYSSANDSDRLRLAATLVAVPESVPLIHYYAETEGATTIDKYVISDVDDLLRTGFLQRPAHLVPHETIRQHIFTPLTVGDFEVLYQAVNAG